MNERRVQIFEGTSGASTGASIQQEQLVTLFLKELLLALNAFYSSHPLAVLSQVALVACGAALWFLGVGGNTMQTVFAAWTLVLLSLSPVFASYQLWLQQRRESPLRLFFNPDDVGCFQNDGEVLRVSVGVMNPGAFRAPKVSMSVIDGDPDFVAPTSDERLTIRFGEGDFVRDLPAFARMYFLAVEVKRAGKFGEYWLVRVRTDDPEKDWQTGESLRPFYRTDEPNARLRVRLDWDGPSQIADVLVDFTTRPIAQIVPVSV